MAVKRQKQSKFLKIISIPIKLLGKARDKYVSCASSGSYVDSVGEQFPKSYSTGSSMTNVSDDYKDLIRAASVRTLGHRNEVDMLLHEAKLNAKPLPKSCSAGMVGIMGRIDEDKAEDNGSGANAGIKKGPSELYSRSKSYAVGQTNVAAF